MRPVVSTIERPPVSVAPGARGHPGTARTVGRLAVKVVAPLGGLLLLGLIWQAAVAVFDVPIYILPPPSKFVPSIGYNWSVLWSATLVTAEEIIYGFVLGAVVSIPLALLFSSVRWIRAAFYPLVVFLQVIPKIAVAPLLIIWFGANKQSVVILTFTLCFFPILVNALAGFTELEERQLYISRSMGASRWQTFKYIRLKSAMPFIFAGFKIAIVLAVTGVIVGQFVGSNAGLGYVLEAATGILNTPLIFADLVVLSVLGLIANYVIVGLEWLAMPWRRGKGAS